MDIIRWMQDPELVVRLQTYFGIEKIDGDEDHTQQPKTCRGGYNTRSSMQGHQAETGNLTCSIDGSNTPSSSSGSSSMISSSSGSKLYQRIIGMQMVGGSEVAHESTQKPSFIIRNKFWFWLFSFASLTGDEIFYTLFFTTWQWNVDGAVMRRVMIVWMITMYIGQALKDLLQIPRPLSPPVVRVDSKWVLEYGLPSTHAAVSLALPSTLLICSYDRYQMSWPLYAVAVVLWSVTVSTSRVYLGMHTLLDLVCGQLLAGVLLLVLVPMVDVLDSILLQHPSSPLVLFGLTVAMVAAYPATATWNPARGDTAVILGVGCGNLMGSWLNYQTGVIAPPPRLGGIPLSRYPIIWPGLAMCGLTLLRTAFGLSLLLLIRHIVRSVAMRGLCAIMQVEVEDYLDYNRTETKKKRAGKDHTSTAVSRVQHCFIECGYKLLTYISIGFFITALGPACFRLIGIERSTYSTEV